MAKSKQHENKMDRYGDITTAIIRRKKRRHIIETRRFIDI